MEIKAVPLAPAFAAGRYCRCVRVFAYKNTDAPAISSKAMPHSRQQYWLCRISLLRIFITNTPPAPMRDAARSIRPARRQSRPAFISTIFARALAFRAYGRFLAFADGLLMRRPVSTRRAADQPFFIALRFASACGRPISAAGTASRTQVLLSRCFASERLSFLPLDYAADMFPRHSTPRTYGYGQPASEEKHFTSSFDAHHASRPLASHARAAATAML